MYSLTHNERKQITRLLNKSMAGLNVSKSCQALEDLKSVIVGMSFENKKELHADIIDFIIFVKRLERHKKNWQNGTKNARYAEIARE